MSCALAGRRAIVTGAASGMGQAVAIRYAREGASVAICDRDRQGLEETAARARDQGGVVFPSAFDLVNTAAIASFVEQAAHALGGIDIVYNNAGLAIREPIESQDEAGWDFVMAVNLRAHFFMAKHALPFLRRGKDSTIINVSSMAGQFGISGLVAYCASKGGVDMLTRALAAELAPDNIRVNGIAPGSIRTPAVQRSIDRIDRRSGKGKEAIEQLTARQLFRRAADPDEVAAIAVFLASSEASFLTGEIINASAGWAAN